MKALILLLVPSLALGFNLPYRKVPVTVAPPVGTLSAKGVKAKALKAKSVGGPVHVKATPEVIPASPFEAAVPVLPPPAPVVPHVRQPSI